MIGAKRGAVTGSKAGPSSAGGSLDGTRWAYVAFLAVIAVATAAGVISAAALAQARAALAIAIVAVAFLFPGRALTRALIGRRSGGHD